MDRRFRDYREILMGKLQDMELAVGYLNEALKDENPILFLIALKDVLEAQGVQMAAVETKRR